MRAEGDRSKHYLKKRFNIFHCLNTIRLKFVWIMSIGIKYQSTVYKYGEDKKKHTRQIEIYKPILYENHHNNPVPFTSVDRIRL